MILVDTGALYALIDKNDVNHLPAKRLYKQNVGEVPFCLSLPILTEACLLIEARLGSYFANTLWASVVNGVFETLEIDRNDLNRAFEIESKYKKSGFGFVDSTCFALCEKYKIIEVFTFDRKHFSIYKPSFSAFLKLLP